MYLDIRRVGSYVWRHKVPLAAVAILAMMNHKNAEESKSKGEFITSKGLNQEYWCFKEMK